MLTLLLLLIIAALIAYCGFLKWLIYIAGIWAKSHCDDVSLIANFDKELKNIMNQEFKKNNNNIFKTIWGKKTKKL